MAVATAEKLVADGDGDDYVQGGVAAAEQYVGASRPVPITDGLIEVSLNSINKQDIAARTTHVALMSGITPPPNIPELWY